MSKETKTIASILEKLGIESLNKMQLDAGEAILNNDEIVLLSPTGTGKTLAFLLPVIELLNAHANHIQVLILVPSRELAIQIEQVIRGMGTGFKTNAVYGGKSGNKDKIELKNPPDVLVGTPGRIADHIRRENIDVKRVETLVLDEFDKSLEVGFEKEMKEICAALPSLKRKILTSATQKIEVPEFVGLKNVKKLDYLTESSDLLKIKLVISPDASKLESLEKLLKNIGNGRGIVFCNFKESIYLVCDFLQEKGIRHAYFHGGLEQSDRERALIKFRNGTHRLLVSTDLAARGIDVPELDFIVHFEIPAKKDEFVHRNGRTARMNSNGIAYVLNWKDAYLPDFIEDYEEELLESSTVISKCLWDTLYISGGRRDKISKADVAGLFLKQGGLDKEELGLIEIQYDCAYVAVPVQKSKSLIEKLNNSKLKKRKVRITLLK